jgi:hypothetical protein
MIQRTGQHILIVLIPLAMISIFTTAAQNKAPDTLKNGVIKSNRGPQQGRLQSKDQNSAQEHAKPPQVVVQVEAPAVDDHRADRQEENEIQKKLADYTFWLVAFTAVLAIVSGVQGYFLYQQARHLREHAGHLHTLAGAATDNARAAHLTAQAVIDSERGWLQVTLGNVQLPTGIAPQSLMAFFLFPTVTNKGKTVCRLTEMFITKRFAKSRLDLPDSPVYEDKGGADSETSVLRDEVILVPDFPLTPLGIEISMTEISRIRDAAETLYVYGYVRYEISGPAGQTTRFTRFCFHYHIPGGFNPLPEGFLMPTGLPEYTRAI